SENDLSVLSNLGQSVDSVVKNPLYSDYKIDFTAAVILDNQLYLAAFGNSKIIFKRHNQISILLNGNNNQVETLFGSIKIQDRIFLLTNSFYEKVTWAKIKLFLSDLKVQNIEENFLSAIYALPSTINDLQSNLAAAFIEIESEDSEILTVQESPQNVISEPIISEKPVLNISKISQFLKKFKKSNSVFVSHHETKETNKRKKLSILFGIILILVLFFSLYFGIRKSKAQKIENQYQSLKTEIETQITNINKTKNLNIDSAREAATVAQQTVEKMLVLKIHQEDVLSYDSQLKNILSQTGSTKTPAPDLLYDTKNTIASANFEKLIFNNNKIYLLDPQNGRLDYYDINNKSTKNILISEKIKNALNISFDKTNLYLMNKESISLVEKEAVTSKIDLTDVKAIDFKFWNGAAYVLDSSNQVIWKFNPNATGFSKAQNWLKNDAKLELGAVSLSINGKVWVLYQNGSITPYLTGIKSEFKPSQVSQFTVTSNLDVTQEKELLTFVDDNNIIYLYQKSGELLSKKNLGDLKINDIAFNEANNLIYILCSDQKIYSIKF
ncbi:MAG: hypothetical protein WCY28_02140, partial [Candidatus Shapirobacteria bacterium]